MTHTAKFILFVLSLAVLSSTPIVVSAQETSPNIPEVSYAKGEVRKILTQSFDDDPLVPSIERFSQRVEVEVLSGSAQGQFLELSYVPGTTGLDGQNNLRIGDRVLLAQTTIADEPVIYIVDRYRLNSAIGIFILFLALAIIFAGWKGFRSILGLAFSLLVIIWFVIPAILAGRNPLLVAFGAALIIAVISIYLAHGVNRRTTIALGSTLITILLALGLAVWFVSWAKLFGLGTEEAFYVQIGDYGIVNLRGLLLGGIIIGVLGVLDDITTAQSAVVDELHKANPKLNPIELFKRGLSVGHEHIASLINTLVLAYVGASFPLLLLFTQTQQPLWVALNSERVVEEIIRTLVGSSTLILAVPITTLLAAFVIGKSSSPKLKTTSLDQGE